MCQDVPSRLGFGQPWPSLLLILEDVAWIQWILMQILAVAMWLETCVVNEPSSDPTNFDGHNAWHPSRAGPSRLKNQLPLKVGHEWPCKFLSLRDPKNPLEGYSIEGYIYIYQKAMRTCLKTHYIGTLSKIVIYMEITRAWGVPLSYIII